MFLLTRGRGVEFMSADAAIRLGYPVLCRTVCLFCLILFLTTICWLVISTVAAYVAYYQVCSIAVGDAKQEPSRWVGQEEARLIQLVYSCPRYGPLHGRPGQRDPSLQPHLEI